MVELYTRQPPWIYKEDQFLPNNSFLSQLEEEAPQPFIDIVKSCLKMNPKERPSFVEIKPLLQELLGQEFIRRGAMDDSDKDHR